MMRYSILIILISFIFVGYQLQGQSPDAKEDNDDIRKLTEKFLWDHFFEVRDGYDSLLGPRKVLEPKLKNYPFMVFIFDYLRERSNIIGKLPKEYNLSENTDSFFMVIPERFRHQIVPSSQYDVPNRIFPGRYFKLSPLIPAQDDNHYMFLRYLEHFGGYRLDAYYLRHENGNFEILLEENWERTHLGVYQEFLSLITWKRPIYKDSNLNSKESDVDHTTHAIDFEAELEDQLEEILCLILKELNYFTQDGEIDPTQFQVINYLNHGNPRLDYMMNYSLRHQPDTLGNFRKYEWEVDQEKLCRDDRLTFSEKLSWVYDPDCANFCFYSACEHEFNTSMSSIYYNEIGNLNVILDFYNPYSARRMLHQTYFIHFGFEEETSSFYIKEVEFLFGELRYFFWDYD